MLMMRLKKSWKNKGANQGGQKGGRKRNGERGDGRRIRVDEKRGQETRWRMCGGMFLGGEEAS